MSHPSSKSFGQLSPLRPGGRRRPASLCALALVTLLPALMVLSACQTGSRGLPSSLVIPLAAALKVLNPPGTFPAGEVGIPYNFSITFTGGTPNGSGTFGCSATNLPAGLMIASTSTPIINGVASCVISGTPTVVFSGTVVVTISDSSVPPQLVQFTGTFMVTPPFTFINFTPQTGEVNAAYSETFTSMGGNGNLTSCMLSPMVPGLMPTFSGATCTISGTPTAPFAGNITLTAQDTGNASSPKATAMATAMLTIQPALAVTAFAFGTGEVGAVYNLTIATTGGILPITCMVSGLPAGTGLSVTPMSPNCVLMGTPTAADVGTRSITVTATDSGSSSTGAVSANGAASLTVNARLAVGAFTLANGINGRAFTQNVSVSISGGIGPYTCTVSGLTFGLTSTTPMTSATACTFTVNGPATSVGTASVTVTVMDTGDTSSVPVTVMSGTPNNLTVRPEFAFTGVPLSFPDGVVGRPYGTAGGTSPQILTTTVSTTVGNAPLTVCGFTAGTNLMGNPLAETPAGGPPASNCALASTAVLSMAGALSLTITAKDTPIPDPTNAAVVVVPANTITAPTAVALAVQLPLTTVVNLTPQPVAVQLRTYGAPLTNVVFTATGGIGNGPALAISSVGMPPAGITCTPSAATPNTATTDICNSAGNPIPITTTAMAYPFTVTASDVANAATPAGTNATDPNRFVNASITVNGPLTVSALNLANGISLRNFTQNIVLTASGGTLPLTACNVLGLPFDGLSNTATVLTPGVNPNMCTFTINGPAGATAVTISTTVTVTVTDTASVSVPAGNAPAGAANDLTIRPEFVFNAFPAAFPDGVVGRPYGTAGGTLPPTVTTTVSATVGNAPLTACGFAGGTVLMGNPLMETPAGGPPATNCALASTAVLSMAGTLTVTINATDSPITDPNNGAVIVVPANTITGATAISLPVQNPLVTVVNLNPVPVAVQGRTYGAPLTNLVFTATGGIGNGPSLAISAGMTPQQITCTPSAPMPNTPGTDTCNSGGVILPNTSTTQTFTVTAGDMANSATPSGTGTDPMSSLTRTITVNTALALSAPNLANGVDGRAFTQNVQLTGTNGALPLTACMVTGGLPFHNLTNTAPTLTPTTSNCSFTINGPAVGTGTTMVTVMVTDMGNVSTPAGNATATSNMLVIRSEFAFTGLLASFPDGVVGRKYGAPAGKTSPTVSTNVMATGPGNAPLTACTVMQTGGNPLTETVSGTSMCALSSMGAMTLGPAGTFNLLITATDSDITDPTNGAVVVVPKKTISAASQVPITVQPALAFSPAVMDPLPRGTQNVAYTTVNAMTVGGAGGLAPCMSTGFPANTLTVGTAAPDCTISGTPTVTAPSTAVSITATDMGNSAVAAGMVTANSHITIVAQGGTPAITDTTVPDGVTNRTYTLTFLVSAGTPAYTWSNPGAALGVGNCAGLALSAAGVLSGTPTAAGPVVCTFMARVTDSAAMAATKTFMLSIRSEFAFNAPTALPLGVQGRTYGLSPLTAPTETTNVSATMGNAPLSACTVTGTGGNAALASAVAASTTDCTLMSSVSPTTLAASGTFNLTFHATDTPILDPLTNSVATPSNTVNSAAVALMVNQPLGVVAAHVVNGLVGFLYPGTTFTATGGTGVGPVTWTEGGATSGTGLCAPPPPGPPAGLMLGSASGMLTGTPTTPSVTDTDVTFQICAEDAATSAVPAGATPTPNPSFTVNVLNTLAFAGEFIFNNSVEVINTTTNTRVGPTITLGGPTLGVAIRSDGTRAFVADLNGNTITPIDTITRTAGAAVALPAGCGSPFDVAATHAPQVPITITLTSEDAGRTTATITTASAHGLSPGFGVIISGVSDPTFDGTFTVASTPSGTMFTVANTMPGASVMGNGGTSSEAGRVFVTCISTTPAGVHFEEVAILDSTSLGRIAEIVTGVGSLPSNMTIQSDDSHVYVTLNGVNANQLFVIDNNLATPAPVLSSPFALTPRMTFGGSALGGIALATNGANLYAYIPKSNAPTPAIASASASFASPLVMVTLSAPLGVVAGDMVFISGLGFPVNENGGPFPVAVGGTTTFTYVGPNACPIIFGCFGGGGTASLNLVGVEVANVTNVGTSTVAGSVTEVVNGSGVPNVVFASTPTNPGPLALAVDEQQMNVFVTLIGTKQFTVLDNTLVVPAQIAGAPFNLPDPSGGAIDVSAGVTVPPDPSGSSTHVYFTSNNAPNDRVDVLTDARPPTGPTATTQIAVPANSGLFRIVSIQKPQ